MLVDRADELAALQGVIAAARDGLSATLVVRGEAGIGKTALLERAIDLAVDMRVARVVGVEAEMEFAFAAVHQLLLPLLSRMEQLPAPQRDALASAFGLIEGGSPDRFLVGLAVLTMLAGAGAEQPLLCVIDDAQWLDQASAQVLAFVARRLYADRIGFLFAVREPVDRPLPLDGLSELRLVALPADAARALVASVAPDAAESVVSRLVSEAAGNPLALIDVSSELSHAQLTGVVRLPELLPLGDRLEARILQRVRTLPGETQALLLLAAAEPSGDLMLLERAAGCLSLGMEAAAPAEAGGLLALSPRLSFRHPLIRSAIYHGAPPAARREAHRALALATDGGLDADRRAWHLAAAAVGPDEQAAAALEASADRARRRGGLASSAGFLTRAAELTPDQGRRALRTVAAAEAELAAGDPAHARALLAGLGPRPEDRLVRARARRVEGTIKLVQGRPAEAPAILIDAARAYESIDARSARDILLDALQASLFAGRYVVGDGAVGVARAAGVAPRVPETEATVSDLLLDGFAARLAVGYSAGAPLLHRAVAMLIREEASADELLSRGALGCVAAAELLDFEAQRELAERWVRVAREQGALATLVLALNFLTTFAEIPAGRFANADAAFAEARDIAAATGNPGVVGTAGVAEVFAHAWRGRASTYTVAEEVTREAIAAGRGADVTAARYAQAVLELGLGNYEAALPCAAAVYDDDPPFMGTWVLPDLIEAATRTGQRGAAQRALERLTERAVASGAEGALGLLARSQALMEDDEECEPLYEQAIQRLEACGVATQIARAHLLYGEWLRRRRRRRDARDELRVAYGMLDAMGAEAFAHRARAELSATGERARKRKSETRDDLTPQEDRIARLAAEGASNVEIAAQLFISASTVEYHLRKVFRKLDVGSRTQLARALAGVDDAQSPPVLHDAGVGV